MALNRFTAPDGVVYVAQDADYLCNGCAFRYLDDCSEDVGGPSCVRGSRPDRRDIIWVREDAAKAGQGSSEAEPVASDLAPRESLLAHIADLTARAELAEQTLARAGWEHIPDAVGGPIWKPPVNTTAAKLRAERDELAARLADQIDALCSELKAAHDVLLRKRTEVEVLRRERDAARDALYTIDRMLGHDDADDEIRTIISAALAAKGA